MNARSEVRPASASPPDVVRDLLRLGLGLIVAALTLSLALRGAALGGLRSALGRADVFRILAGSPLRARGIHHQMAKCAIWRLFI